MSGGCGESDFLADTPEQNAKEVADKLTAAPEGVAGRLAGKYDRLGESQKSDGISERIVEAAIKEWVAEHGGDFDWSLEGVTAICLRNKRNGIPPD